MLNVVVVLYVVVNVVVVALFVAYVVLKTVCAG